MSFYWDWEKLIIAILALGIGYFVGWMRCKEKHERLRKEP